MVFEYFSWHPILADADVGDHLRCGTDDYARVLPTGSRNEWIATVNLHRPMNQHKAAVREWLRGALAAADFP